MRLQVEHLRKVYPDGTVALDDFNLALDNGVFGLLGPNGAGKSTLLESLSLNLQPTSGRILWDGLDVYAHPRQYRQILGYLPQVYGFYPELKVETQLEYLGKLHGVRGAKLQERIEWCLNVVGLLPFRRRKTKTLSGGMRQRLAIAQALLHEPQLLVIDEPTTGLDLEERLAFRNMLFDLGRTTIIFLSTHIVKDVEFSCQEMMLLFGGVQQFTGDPAEFMRRVAGRVFEMTVPVEQLATIMQEQTVVAIHERGQSLDVRYILPPDAVPPARDRMQEPNLEDAYVDFIRECRKEAALVEAE